MATGWRGHLSRPGANFDWAAVGVPPDWHQHIYSGFAAHWNKNSNLGQAFDVWFLNLFPRARPFAFNGGGYLTLSFIPTLGTMILGLIAGRWFHEAAPKIPLRKFMIAAIVLMAAGLVLHFTGVCPIVKRIWTPSWTLWSGGVCFVFLAAFSWIVDVKGNQKLAFPLVVVGMNSIAAYLIAHLWEDFVLTASGFISACACSTQLERRSSLWSWACWPWPRIVNPLLDVPKAYFHPHLTSREGIGTAESNLIQGCSTLCASHVEASVSALDRRIVDHLMPI